MRKGIRHAGLLGGAVMATAVVWFAGCGTAGEGAPGEVQRPAALTVDPDSSAPKVHTRALCDHGTAPGVAHCYAQVVTDESGIVQFAGTPKGLGPSDLRSAYKIPSTGGGGKIIAIVDAMDDPNAEADLGVYRAQYGLPPCTTA